MMTQDALGDGRHEDDRGTNKEVTSSGRVATVRTYELDHRSTT